MSHRYLVTYLGKSDSHELTEEITFRDDRQYRGPEAAAWEVAIRLVGDFRLVSVRDLDAPLPDPRQAMYPRP